MMLIKIVGPDYDKSSRHLILTLFRVVGVRGGKSGPQNLLTFIFNSFYTGVKL